MNCNKEHARQHGLDILESECPSARGNEHVFTTIARAYYAEVEETGKSPRILLNEFGLGLGLDYRVVIMLRKNAAHHASSQRRIKYGNGGGSIRPERMRKRWVMEDWSVIKQ